MEGVGDGSLHSPQRGCITVVIVIAGIGRRWESVEEENEGWEGRRDAAGGGCRAAAADVRRSGLANTTHM